MFDSKARTYLPTHFSVQLLTPSVQDEGFSYSPLLLSPGEGFSYSPPQSRVRGCSVQSEGSRLRRCVFLPLILCIYAWFMHDLLFFPIYITNWFAVFVWWGRRVRYMLWLLHDMVKKLLQPVGWWNTQRLIQSLLARTKTGRLNI